MRASSTFARLNFSTASLSRRSLGAKMDDRGTDFQSAASWACLGRFDAIRRIVFGVVHQLGDTITIHVLGGIGTVHRFSDSPPFRRSSIQYRLKELRNHKKRCIYAKKWRDSTCRILTLVTSIGDRTADFRWGCILGPSANTWKETCENGLCWDGEFARVDFCRHECSCPIPSTPGSWWWNRQLRFTV